MKKVPIVITLALALAGLARAQFVTTPGGGGNVSDGGTNGAIFRDSSGNLHATGTGGAGTLCLTSANGGTPIFGACSGSAATAFSALTTSTNTSFTGTVGSGATITFTGTGIINARQIYGTDLSSLATGVLKNTTATGVPFISKVAITEPATGATLTIPDGVTFTGPAASGTAAVVGNPLSQFASTTSAQLAGVISNETGSGALMFGTSPTASGLTLSDVATGTQCLHANSSGVVSGTGVDCGSGSGGVTSVSFTGGLISVGTPTTTPALTVAGTNGGIPFFSSASTWASSAALGNNFVVLGGGGGGAPKTTAALGTAGWVLTSNGPASAPTMQAIPAPSGFANDTLSNLATTAINTGLTPGSSAKNLGAFGNGWNDIYFGTGTFGSTHFRITGAPTTFRTVTFQDQDYTLGNIALTNGALKGDGAQNAVPVTGTGSNCVHVDGTSAACAAGGTSSVFDGSTATAPTFSATPTFSLANVSATSPVRIETGSMTANVTSVTFTNKTAGAKFSIVWPQDATGSRTVAYGASATGTCGLNPTPSTSTTQFFEVGADGTTVNGVNCTSTANDALFGPEEAAPATPASTFGRSWFDSTNHIFSSKNPSGTVSNTVVPDTGASNNFLTAISAAGVVSKAQPAFSNISGTCAIAQGCTNGTDAADNGGIVWSNASGYKILAHTTTAGLPLLSGNAATPSWGTVTGNTTQFPTWTGATTSARCVDTDASGNLHITASDCGSATGVTSVNTNAGAVTLFNTNAKTATYQVLAADFTQCKTIPVASGTFTITLVASGSQPADGQCITILSFTSGVVTIARSGQNINGGTASYVMESGSATNPSVAHVFSDGTNYFVSGGFANPMTTAGDVIYAGTTGLPTRLAIGSATTVLHGGASAPAYSAVSLTADVTGVLPTANIAVALANQTSIHGITAGTAAGDATLGQVIAHGAKALATSAISSAACSTAQTATATGTVTTDVINATFNGDPTAVTGYVPLTAGMLTIIAYPTADTVNFKVCNNTTSSITPGAITLNWNVVR